MKKSYNLIALAMGDAGIENPPYDHQYDAHPPFQRNTLAWLSTLRRAPFCLCKRGVGVAQLALEDLSTRVLWKLVDDHNVLW
jgi:hypothetical protein